MPLVAIKGVSGYLSPEQKKALIERVTDAVLSVEGEGIRPVTWVILEDVPEGQWGVGGSIATAQMLRDMAAASSK